MHHPCQSARHWSDHSSRVVTITCYDLVVDNSCHKSFALDMFIYDAVVVLLVDLQGIAIKTRCDGPFPCTSTTYGMRLLRSKQLKNLMVHDITRIRKIHYDTWASMIPRINHHCTLWNGLPFRLLLSNFGLYWSWRHQWAAMHHLKTAYL